jgi:glyoxylase-like metal-dependent hydrolase (beta-lactamase superfamily II)
MDRSSTTSLPPPSVRQAYVSISPLTGGFITLPERFFVFPSDPDAKQTVPSLVFLITHPGIADSERGEIIPIHLMFDLGLRSQSSNYTPEQQGHLSNRQPVILEPRIADKLSKGDICAATEVDFVLLSHVHYDHHGDPEDFKESTFLVGNGSLKILQDGLQGAGSHQHFQPGILPDNRTIELPQPSENGPQVELPLKNGNVIHSKWATVGPFPFALDIFADGSTYVVDSPGHLPGHLNLLCRMGPRNWVYLGGDACHDIRLLTGEKEVGTWKDADGHTLCIHLDKESAEKTLRRIAQLKSDARAGQQHVEVIMAHDALWLESHRHELFPARLQC